MKIYLLFKTDFNHSFASRDLISVFTNKSLLSKEVKKIITEDLKTDSGQMDYEEEKINIKWNIDFFKEKNQTQGLNSFELVLEEVTANELI